MRTLVYGAVAFLAVLVVLFVVGFYLLVGSAESEFRALHGDDDDWNEPKR